MSDLFCVNLLGPDDIYACAGREEADKLAAEFNAFFTSLRKLGQGFEPTLSAVVIPWPWGAESHARDLQRGDQRFR
jgi:hypothetical protein